MHHNAALHVCYHIDLYIGILVYIGMPTEYVSICYKMQYFPGRMMKHLSRCTWEIYKQEAKMYTTWKFPMSNSLYIIMKSHVVLY